VKRGGLRSNHRPLDKREIAHTIQSAFTSDPDNAFTTADLCKLVYPGSRPKRKHRTAVIAAAKKVSQLMGEHRCWSRGENVFFGLRGAPFVFWNRASVLSYAMARMKTDNLDSCYSDEELRAKFAPGGDHHKYVVEGGAWWGHCQDDIAKFKDRHLR
jgi:hypothetical protein